MISLAKLSIRRPKVALAGWLLAGIFRAAIVFGVSRTLSPSVTVVPDSQSARAQQLLASIDHFQKLPRIHLPQRAGGAQIGRSR